MGFFFMSNNLSAKSQDNEHKTAYSYTFETIDGSSLPLSAYKGKVVLVVNTASQCGFTPQYKELQTLYERYKGDGLVIVGVPSGDFGGQEFLHNEEVVDFTHKKFAVTFPLTSIYHVKGKNAHPFYKWARKEYGFIGAPKWNFHKYLLNRQGKLVNWFYSQTKPLSSKVLGAIEVELKKKT